MEPTDENYESVFEEAIGGSLVAMQKLGGIDSMFESMATVLERSISWPVRLRAVQVCVDWTCMSAPWADEHARVLSQLDALVADAGSASLTASEHRELLQIDTYGGERDRPIPESGFDDWLRAARDEWALVDWSERE